MLQKTITKFSTLVISFAVFSACHSSARERASKTGDAESSAGYAAPRVVGRIASPEVTESSGLAASKCQPDVFWTHNDSGNANEIFALDARGADLGKWTVANAKNVDWEDIAEYKNADGECFLYIGDIGNNARTRGELAIYIVREPDVRAGKSAAPKTEPARQIKITYPEFRHDAETLMVHPQTGDVYILSKRLSGAAAVYKLKNNFSAAAVNTLEKIADFSVPAIPNGFLTGGDIAPDGKHVIICDYFNGYELTLPANAANFDEIWSQKPLIVELGEREIGEAVAYSADGSAIYATSEKKNSPLIEVKRK